MSQAHGMHLLRTAAEFVKRRVPGLHIKITDGAGSMTVYVEMTNGSA
jgi:hypothetical protein